MKNTNLKTKDIVCVMFIVLFIVIISAITLITSMINIMDNSAQTNIKYISSQSVIYNNDNSGYIIPQLAAIKDKVPKGANDVSIYIKKHIYDGEDVSQTKSVSLTNETNFYKITYTIKSPKMNCNNKRENNDENYLERDVLKVNGRNYLFYGGVIST